MPPAAAALSRTSAEPTLYEILSLSPKQLDGQASSVAQQKKTIKQAYHKALLKYHPDKNPDSLSSPSSSSPSPAAQAQAHTQSSPPKSQSQSKANSSSSSSSSNSKSGSRPDGSGSGSSSKKAQPSSSSSSSSKKTTPKITYTIDQIQQAYTVLSDPSQRREYDRHLLLLHSQSYSSSSSSSTAKFQTTGIETVDLDDLSFDEETGIYFGSCRCGNARGYQFTDAELEEYEDDLVLMVQCLDCSLWLRVLFDAADEEEEEEEEPASQQPKQQQQQGTPTFSSKQRQMSSSSSSSAAPPPPPQQRRQPSSSPSSPNRNSASASNRNLAGAFANYGLNSINLAAQTLSTRQQQQQQQQQQRGISGNLARERNGSLDGARRGKGWQFNFSFNWGISLSGSGSAAASSNGRL